jgi:NTE family protein
MTRSVVLGGGGIVGIAWLVGVVEGLADHGLDLMGTGAPDDVIGTSAGSVVGALLAKGVSAADMRAFTLDQSSVAVIGQALPHVDLAAMVDCFAVWGALPDDSPAALSTVGERALKAPTMSEAEWAHAMAVVGTDWPRTDELAGPRTEPGITTLAGPRTEPGIRFRCTAVNARTGEFVLWDASSGIDLDVAVTSSCTVPCLFPPVTINGERYIDGGVRSGTSAEFATGDTVLVLAPIGSNSADPMDTPARQQLNAEIALLQARGANVVELLPDDETNAATLASPLGRMDPDSREAALTHGRRQASTIIDLLAAW